MLSYKITEMGRSYNGLGSSRGRGSEALGMSQTGDVDNRIRVHFSHSPNDFLISWSTVVFEMQLCLKSEIIR